MLSEKIVVKIGGDFDPVPMDVYTLQLVDVSSVTSANPFKGGVMEEKLNYQFAILDEDKKMDDGSPVKGRFLWMRCTPVLSEKSWLQKMVVAIYGRALTADEQKNFDAEAIIGKQVKGMVETKASKTGDRIFNNIVSFSHVTKELTPIEFTPKPAVVEKTSVGIAIDNQEIDPEAEIKKLEEEKAKK